MLTAWLLAAFVVTAPSPAPARVFAPAPVEDGPEEVTRVVVDDRTRVYLDGKRVKYDEVPPTALVVELRVRKGRGPAVVTVIKFESRGRAKGKGGAR